MGRSGGGSGGGGAGGDGSGGAGVGGGAVGGGTGAGEVGDGGGELGGLDGFGDVHLEAGIERGEAVFFAGVGGEGDGGDVAALAGGELAEGADEVVAVAIGHGDIGDEDVGAGAGG